MGQRGRPGLCHPARDQMNLFGLKDFLLLARQASIAIMKFLLFVAVLLVIIWALAKLVFAITSVALNLLWVIAVILFLIWVVAQFKKR